MQQHDGMSVYAWESCLHIELSANKFNADMYSKVALDQHLYDDPEELDEINLPCPVEENDETGRAKKMRFHELEGSDHTG